ncbi:hyphally regulated cell wall protein 1 isoform X2 [Pieris rapae]|uniref:hyphally regulated cell wall protein 1 isoform X2 n=1 Tax=Pieris rapae TaxID=64459 RepID=UPI001E27F88F|nr:hyphally regulated cell wall protein 1 isoform X2 [Pieris rapae]
MMAVKSVWVMVFNRYHGIIANMTPTFALIILNILYAHADHQDAPILPNYWMWNNGPPYVPPTSYSPSTAPAEPSFAHQGYPPNFLKPINAAQATTYTSDASKNDYATSDSSRIFGQAPKSESIRYSDNYGSGSGFGSALASGNTLGTSSGSSSESHSCLGIGSCTGKGSGTGSGSCLGAGSCSGINSGKGPGSCSGQGSCSGAGSGSGSESCSGSSSCTGINSGKLPGSCSEIGSCTGPESVNQTVHLLQ